MNTDLITPGRMNLTANEKELAEICFAECRPEFAKEVSEGDFIVAGKNFGSGSSRESAALAIKASGVKGVFAESFARIFYRNAINIALPVYFIENSNGFEEGEEVELCLEEGILENKGNGSRVRIGGVSENLQRIISAGGIVEYLNKERSLEGLL